MWGVAMSRRTLGIVASATVWAAFSPSADAQTPTMTYELTSATAQLVSIANTSNQLSFSSTDDGSASFNLPFDVTFFGQRLTAGRMVYVGTNGTFDLLSSNTDFGNDPIPTTATPNGMVAVFWDDMSVSGATGWWQASGVAPNQVLTVEWTNVMRLSSSDTITMQVKLHQSDGHFEVLYGSRVGGSTTNATIGIEGPLGQLGAQLPCSSSCTYADVPQGTMLVYTQIAIPPPDVDLQPTFATPPPASVVEGQTFTLDYAISNNGSEPAGISRAALYLSETSPVTAASTQIAANNVGTLIPGGATQGSFTVVVPQGLLTNTPYFLGVIADIDEQVIEIDETNNTFVAGSFTIGVAPNGPISVTTTSLGPGRVGDPYSATFTQMPATAPDWSIVSGRLPAGLALAPDGRVSGTPTADGQFGFRVQASQAGYSPGYGDLVLTIAEAGGLRVDTMALPQARVGEPYSTAVSASGGMAPYAFQAVSGVPAWMTVISDGSISGTPDAVGTHMIEVSVFDSQTNFASGTVVVEVVQPGPLAMSTTPDQVSPGQNGVPYTFTFVAAGGQPPYAWAITTGSPTPGLTLGETTGVLAGVPTEVGETTFTVTVLDALSAQQSVTVTVRITERIALAVTLPARITLPFGQMVDHPLTAEGGEPPYVWTTMAGGLPAGLSIDGGAIRGVATSSVASTVTFVVTDALRATDAKEVVVHARSNGGGNNGGGTSSGGGRRTGGAGSGRGGCVCVAAESDRPSPWLLLGLGLVLSGAWRRRRFLLNDTRD